MLTIRYYRIVKYTKTIINGKGNNKEPIILYTQTRMKRKSHKQQSLDNEMFSSNDRFR